MTGKCRSGGIGRRLGLKIPWEKSRAGSIPVSGTKYRGIEQLVARRAHNPEVGGSSPPPATMLSDQNRYTHLETPEKSGVSTVSTAIFNVRFIDIQDCLKIFRQDMN